MGGSYYYLPSDSVVCILERLPVKSLTRFKSLSKGCCGMITDSKFIRNHLENMKSRQEDYQDFIFLRTTLPYSQQLLFSRIPYGQQQHVKAEIIEPPPIEEPHDVMGKWSVECDGLLCIPLNHSLVVWNPATKAHRIIPGPPEPCNIVSWALGFGYDSATDDYKVINIHPQRDKKPTLIQTLRLKTSSSWTTAENEVPRAFCAGWQSSKTVDGCIYWLADKVDSKNRATAVHFIVAFDLEKERMREVVFPDNRLLTRTKCVLGILRGSLCVTRYERKSSSSRLTDCFDVNVWLMNSATKSWENLFKFPAYSTPRRRLSISTHYNNKTQLLTNEEIKSSEDLKSAEIYVYNLKDGSLPANKIEIEGLSKDTTFSIITYTESLVSPHQQFVFP